MPPKKKIQRIKTKKRTISQLSSYAKSGRWWDLITRKSSDKKWKTLVHNGPFFPSPYEPLPDYIKITHKGLPLTLDKNNTKNSFHITSEEAAYFYAQALETNDRTLLEGKKQSSEDIRKDKVFKRNFLKDWKKIMGASGKIIKSLDDVDFSEFISNIELSRVERESKKKNMSTQEKELEKLRKEELKNVFSYAQFDGILLPAANNIEPPSLFKGHGESQDRGRIKARIVPSDVTLNISTSDVPECYSNGDKCKWGGIVSDKNAVWLSKWKNPINGKPVYTKINRNFDPWVGRNDFKKFEKARNLNNKIEKIREKYTKDFKNNTELALAVYLLDRIAIRPGTEKGEEGTRGLTTLKCDNIKWNNSDNSMIINFVGKSSIKFDKKIQLEKKVFDLLKLRCAGKTGNTSLFPNVNSRTLNEYLGSLSKGLTAKVFRTWKASSEVDKELRAVKIPKGADLQRKKEAFVKANLNAAITLNHKRMTDNSDKIKKITTKIKTLKKDLKDATTASKKKTKKNQISAEKLKLSEAENNVNIGTSKANYIDPRIIVSWAKTHDIPIESIYKTGNDRTRFIWSMETPSTWRFDE